MMFCLVDFADHRPAADGTSLTPRPRLRAAHAEEPSVYFFEQSYFASKYNLEWSHVPCPVALWSAAAGRHRATGSAAGRRVGSVNCGQNSPLECNSVVILEKTNNYCFCLCGNKSL